MSLCLSKRFKTFNLPRWIWIIAVLLSEKFLIAKYLLSHILVLNIHIYLLRKLYWSWHNFYSFFYLIAWRWTFFNSGSEQNTLTIMVHCTIWRYSKIMTHPYIKMTQLITKDPFLTFSNLVAKASIFRGWCLYCLIFIAILVLLMWKWIGLSLMVNHLLRGSLLKNV